jgi:hypothetical protein
MQSCLSSTRKQAARDSVVVSGEGKSTRRGALKLKFVRTSIRVERRRRRETVTGGTMSLRELTTTKHQPQRPWSNLWLYAGCLPSSSELLQILASLPSSPLILFSLSHAHASPGLVMNIVRCPKAKQVLLPFLYAGQSTSPPPGLRLHSNRLHGTGRPCTRSEALSSVQLRRGLPRPVVLASSLCQIQLDGSTLRPCLPRPPLRDQRTWIRDTE